MKKNLLLAAFFGMFCLTLQASFPVNKTNVEKADAQIETLVNLDDFQPMQEINLDVQADEALSPAAAADSVDNKIIALVLALLLGWIAAHRWYAKKPAGWNILFIITGGALGIWWLVDVINILTDKF